MGQTVWYQDFPKIRREKDTKGESFACQFFDTLNNFVKSLGANTMFLREYDFRAAKVLLVASVPGYHKGTSLSKYGHMQIRTLLSAENIPPGDKVLMCQTSSIGSMESSWLESMRTSLAVCTSSNSNSAKSEKNKSNVGVKIFYPKFKSAFVHGKLKYGMHMLFCRAKDWSREDFPKKCMYDTAWSSSLDSKSAMVMHSKINFCIDNTGKHYWLYTGSHNFSQVTSKRNVLILVQILEGY